MRSDWKRVNLRNAINKALEVWYCLPLTTIAKERQQQKREIKKNWRKSFFQSFSSKTLKCTFLAKIPFGNVSKCNYPI